MVLDEVGGSVASAARLAGAGTLCVASSDGRRSEAKDSLVHEALVGVDVDLVGLVDLGDPCIGLLPGALIAETLLGDSDLGSLGGQGDSVVDEVDDGLQQMGDGLLQRRASGDVVVHIDYLVECRIAQAG